MFATQDHKVVRIGDDFRKELLTLVLQLPRISSALSGVATGPCEKSGLRTQLVGYSTYYPINSERRFRK